MKIILILIFLLAIAVTANPIEPYNGFDSYADMRRSGMRWCGTGLGMGPTMASIGSGGMVRG